MHGLCARDPELPSRLSLLFQSTLQSAQRKFTICVWLEEAYYSQFNEYVDGGMASEIGLPGIVRVLKSLSCSFQLFQALACDSVKRDSPFIRATSRG